MVPQYADLKAGHHKIALMYNGEAGGFHDALYVSYTGAYGEEYPEFDKIYEAESAISVRSEKQKRALPLRKQR